MRGYSWVWIGVLAFFGLVFAFVLGMIFVARFLARSMWRR